MQQHVLGLECPFFPLKSMRPFSHNSDETDPDHRNPTNEDGVFAEVEGTLLEGLLAEGDAEQDRGAVREVLTDRTDGDEGSQGDSRSQRGQGDQASKKSGDHDGTNRGFCRGVDDSDPLGARKCAIPRESVDHARVGGNATKGAEEHDGAEQRGEGDGAVAAENFGNDGPPTEFADGFVGDGKEGADDEEPAGDEGDAHRVHDACGRADGN